MGSSIVVHIGAPKTGTTAIQQALARDREALRISGVVYAKGVDNFTSHCEVTDVLFRSPENWGRSIRSRYVAADDQELKASFGKQFRDELKDSRFAIMSAETMFSYTEDEIEGVRSVLQAAGFDRIRILVYLRDPLPLYLSTAQQNLKGRSSFPPANRFRIKYSSVIELWEAVFPGCVDVRQYPSASRDIVSDFAGYVQEVFKTDVMEAVETGGKSNMSMSAEAMIVMQTYLRHHRKAGENRFSRDASKLVGILQELQVSGRVPQTKAHLREDVACVLWRNNADEVERVAQRFGVDVTGGQQAERLPYLQPNACRGADFSDEVRAVLSDWDESIVDELLCRALGDALLAGK